MFLKAPLFSTGPFSKEDVKDYFGTLEIEEQGVSCSQRTGKWHVNSASRLLTNLYFGGTFQ